MKLKSLISTMLLGTLIIGTISTVYASRPVVKSLNEKIPLEDIRAWGIPPTLGAEHINDNTRDFRGASIPSSITNTPAFQEAEDRNIIYNYGRKWGGYLYKDGYAYCMDPGNKHGSGNAVEPSVITEVFPYQFMSRVLAGNGQDELSHFRVIIYMRAAMQWSQDSVGMFNAAFGKVPEAVATYFESAFNKTHTGLAALSFPILTSDKTKDIIPEGYELTIDDEIVYVYKFNLDRFTGQGDSWPKGPLHNSVTTIDGGHFGPAIYNFWLGADAPKGSTVIQSNSPEATKYGLDSNKSEFAIVTKCPELPREEMSFRLNYDLSEEINLEATGILVGYAVTDNRQNPGTISTISPSCLITIPGTEAECPDCGPGDPPYEAWGPTCQEEKDPPPPDTSGGDCPSLYEKEVISVRWYNLPTSYAETKNGSGYNEDGETTNGKYTPERNGERFEAMMGVPETEKLYINGGTSEGKMDVSYDYYTVDTIFKLSWTESYVCPGHYCGEDCSPWYHDTGTYDYCRTYKHQFKFLNLKEASYRVPTVMSVVNPNLYQQGSHLININKPVPKSHTLSPNPAGLQVGPGNGSSNVNHGAENSWSTDVDVGTYTITCAYPGPLKESQAISDGNAKVGNIFSQNDQLKIKIGGTDYTFVTDSNKQTCAPFGNDTNLIAAPNPAYFNPINELWSTTQKVPIMGYNGEPEKGSARNLVGSYNNSKPFVKEDVEIVKRQINGIYDFDDFEDKNYIEYGDGVAIKGPIKPLEVDTSNLEFTLGTDIYDTGHYLANANQVKVQYTNWQYNKGTHYEKIPDGKMDITTNDNPHYFSINPVLIHNPTTSIYTWISDIQNNILQDQRIENGSNEDNKDEYQIKQHWRALDPKAPSRQYIDFDFEITFPNDGPFQSYWLDKGGSGKQDSSKSGIEDVDEVSPGTRGKGYIGTSQSKILNRSYTTPYKEQDWDVAKWLNSKYVKFPYDVYYYKNSGEVGGSPKGFYNAGTWIRLYDDSYNVKVGDPTKFKFHIASNQGDLADGTIYYVSENINTPASFRGNAEKLWTDGEWYINGRRDKGSTYTAIGGTRPLMSASHSAVNSVIVDGIGRIGNSLIEDSTDPAWNSVFWDAGTNNQVKSQNVVTKDYGMYYNMFEQISDSAHKYNRWNTMPWHDESIARKLPVMTNPLLTKSKQLQKLGYENQASIQTLGTHDNKIMVYPTYKLLGNYKTGDPKKDHFVFYATDPFDPKGQLRSFYDSRVDIGKFYNPAYKYNLTHTLIDTRGKISDVEKDTPSYKNAVVAGSNKEYYVGQPSWIEINKDLRTWMGSTNSSGFLGYGHKGDMISSNKPDTAWKNAQKWNFRFSLPKATQIMFLNDNNLKNGLFEGRTKNQIIYTEFVYRTWAGFPEWDLTTFTNTGVSPQPDNINNLEPGRIPPIPLNPNDGTNVTVPSDKGNTPDPQPNFPNLPLIPGVIEPDDKDDNPVTGDEDNPATPEIMVDYSNPSDTDKTTIGTH